jgi:ribosomal protein S24E
MATYSKSEIHDFNFPYWRMMLTITNNTIYLSVDNTRFGAGRGELYETIYSDSESCKVVLITEYKDKLETYEQLMLDEMHELLQDELFRCSTEKEYYESRENKMKDILTSVIFRKNKITSILFDE